MIDKSVPGDYATRYYPIIDIEFTICATPSPWNVSALGWT